MTAPQTFEQWLYSQTLRGSPLHDKWARDGWQARQPEIYALRARVAELEQENFRLAAGRCVHPNGIIGSDGGTPLCPITETPDAAMKGQS